MTTTRRPVRMQTLRRFDAGKTRDSGTCKTMASWANNADPFPLLCSANCPTPTCWQMKWPQNELDKHSLNTREWHTMVYLLDHISLASNCNACILKN